MLRLLRHRTSVMDKSVADVAHPKILAWRPLWYWIKNLSDLLSLQYKEIKGKYAASNGRLKAKSFIASGGLRPLTLWPGALPLNPQTPL